MDQILPLNTRTRDQQQRVRVNVTLPEFTTRGRPHAPQPFNLAGGHAIIDCCATLLDNGNISIEVLVRNEDRHIIFTYHEAYHPDELIYDHRTRRKEPNP
jgi:ABC-type Fe3+-hydroxamate transport system substrate-binding protein